MANEVQLVELLFRINRRAWKLFSPVAREAKLSITETLALTIMHKRKTSRVTDLARTIGIPPSTLTGVLDRLVQRGFLERAQDPSDRRSVCMRATPKLGTFMRSWAAPMEARFVDRLQSVAETRKRRLVGDLQAVLDSLDSSEDGVGPAAKKKGARPARKQRG